MAKDKESNRLGGRPGRYLRSFLGGLGVGCLAWFFYTNHAHHNFFLERRIQKQISSYRDHDGGFDLAKMASRPIKKVCIQGPYESREYTEARFREKLPEFHQIDEDRFVWWFFYEDGGMQWIQVPRLLMDFSDFPPFICGDSSLRVEMARGKEAPSYRFVMRGEVQ